MSTTGPPLDVHLPPWRLSALLSASELASDYRARHATGRAAAVRIREGIESAPVLKRVWQEASILASLDHPNIQALFDVGIVPEGLEVTAQAPWFALELAEDGTLAGRVPAPSYTHLARWLSGMLAGLAYAHSRGRLHRNLKASHVLVGQDGVSKLSQFALGEGIVNPGFSPPELIRGDTAHQGPWSDLYSVGVIAWLLATGAMPWDAPRGREAKLEAQLSNARRPFVPALKEVPKDFEVWLNGMLALDPRRRYRHAAEAGQILLRLSKMRGAKPNPMRPPRPRGMGLVGMAEAPMVGRFFERKQLMERLEAGGSQAIIISGRGGSGCTRLAEWLCATAAETHKAIPFRSQARGGGGAVLRLLQDALRWACATSAAELAQVLGVDEQEWAVQAVWGLVAPSGQGQPLERQARDGLIRGTLAALAGDKPALVWIDDAHLDEEAVAFALAALRSSHKLMVVLTVEGGCPAQLFGQPNTSVLQLQPLDPQQSSALARALAPLDAGAVRQAVQAAEGSPLGMCTLLEDWVGSGVVQQGEDGVARVVTEAFPSAALVDVWRRRIARQGVDLEPLEVAAALGVSFEEQEWTRACRAAHLGTPELDPLLEGRILLTMPEGLCFPHHRVREALLQAAEAEGRGERWHRACASVCTGARRAGHRERMGDLIGAAEDYAGAAVAAYPQDERSFLRWAGQAVRLLERADAGHGFVLWGELLGKLSAVKRARGDLEGAREDAEAWAAWAKLHGEDRVVVQALVAQAATLADPEAAIAPLSEAWAMTKSVGDGALEAWVIQRLARAHRAVGELHEALSLVRKGLRVHPGWADLRLDMCSMALQARRYKEARKLLNEELPSLRSEGSPRLAEVLLYDAELRRSEGDTQGAERAAYEAVREAKRVGRDDLPARLMLARLSFHADRLHAARKAALKIIAEDRTGVHRGIGTVIGFSCSALVKDWAMASLFMSKLEAEGLGEVDREVPSMLERAAQASALQGHQDLAARAYRLALAANESLGDVVSAERVRGLLARVEA